MKLKISKEISLPVDAVTQTLAAIGRKGAGKTYLATMIAEQMLEAGSQVIVIDPVGNWWGLRVNADGKSKGKDIFIIGGEHGDVPIVPEAGARIARLLIEKNISAILDVSSFRIGEFKRFAADFAEEFFHLKKTHKTPVHIFIEEAQKIIPQRVGPEEARMVGAFEQIVRLGRNYGIGCTLITQRPQSVNKEVLSQVECLCVLQVTGPHERKALEEWVFEAGADRKLVGELPGLERGEGFVWSPSWLRIYQRVHFSKKETFDASSTPEVGKAEKAAKLSSVDVKALREDLAEVVAVAEKDNPKVLHQRIRDLEEEVRKSNTRVVQTSIKQVKTEVPVLKESQISRLEKIAENMTKEAERHGSAMALLWGNFDEVGTSLAAALETIRDYHNGKVPATTTVDTVPREVPRETVAISNVESDGVTKPEQRILDAIAWANSIGIHTPGNSIIAFLAGYTNPKSTGYTNPRGQLKAKGLIDYPSSGVVKLTQEGITVANHPDRIGSEHDLQVRILQQLTGPQARILKILIDARGTPMSNESVAHAAGYSNVKSTGYTNPRGELRSYGLIEYVTGGVVAERILFL